MTGRALAGLVAAITVTLAAAACGAPAAGHGPSSPGGTGTVPGHRTSLSPPGPPPRSRSCVGTVFARMTAAQRVGQLFLVGLAGGRLGPGTARALRVNHFGSVMFVTTTTAGVRGVRSVSDAVQSLASTRSTAGAGYFIAANQEGGQVQALRGPGFAVIPSALAQGALPVASLRQRAAGWGSSLRAAGVNLNLAPVMDTVPAGAGSRNRPIGLLRREFGHDVSTVTAHGLAFIGGMRAAGVAVTAKHFPGLGRVVGNTDFTSGVTDRVTTARDPYLLPFRAAISSGVPFVMVALATYQHIDPQRIAAFSPLVMRTLLRGRLHFRGVIVSDDLGAAAAVASIAPAERAVAFLAAGGDLIASKTVGPAAVMARAVLRRERADPAFRATVAAAVRHVLAAKQREGLLRCRAR